MSRIGKQPVQLPEKVEIKIDGQNFFVKGPQGSLERTFSDLVTIEKKENNIVVGPAKTNDNKSKALWGLTRTLIQNMVEGVSKGFTKSLEFSGVGYKVIVSGQTMTLNLGYSHPIEYVLPEGVKAASKGNKIDISGRDKELVGLVAAKIRDMRPPEPYKGKGIKYLDEVIIRKAGKTGKK